MIRLGLEVMNNGGVEFVRVREVKVETAAMSEPLRTQGTLVETTCGVEDEGVVLEFAITGGGENTVRAVEGWQEWGHISEKGRRYFERCTNAAFMVSKGGGGVIFF